MWSSSEFETLLTSSQYSMRNLSKRHVELVGVSYENSVERGRGGKRCTKVAQRKRSGSKKSIPLCRQV
jgi:hypothetical protein